MLLCAIGLQPPIYTFGSVKLQANQTVPNSMSLSHGGDSIESSIVSGTTVEPTMSLRGVPSEVKLEKMPKECTNRESRKMLWEQSEKVIGDTFEISDDTSVE